MSFLKFYLLKCIYKLSNGIYIWLELAPVVTVRLSFIANVWLCQRITWKKTHQFWSPIYSKEYFRQDLLAAPTQDLRLNKQAAVILDKEELEEQKDEQMDESINEKKDESINEQNDEWKPLKKRRKEIKRAPNK